MFYLFIFSLQDAQRMGFAGLLRALASGMDARVSAANEQAARLFFFVFFRRIASQSRSSTVWGLGFRV
jgi:hypothetical protein